MTTSVTIDRSGMTGGLDDLVIGTHPEDLWWLDETGGFGRPARTQRRTYAADSPWQDGSLLVASVLAQTSLPLNVYVGGATWAWVDTRQTALERALRQFSYNVTVTVDDVQTVWAADPADISWGDTDPGMVQAFLARAVISIPVYPLPS